MQDIDKFGFNLMALAETENYPWASPEAAVESVMDMSPEEFMITTKNMLLEFEGVEGIGSAIKNAWDWFINLIKRFWNWLSGNDKKEEAMEKKIEKKIDKNNKLLKSVTPKHKPLNNVGTVDDETFKKIDKGMSDKSAVLVIGADDTKDGIKFEHRYWAPNESILENIMRAYIDVDTILETLVAEVASVTNWDSFIYKATNVTDIKTLSKVNTKIEETRKYINIIKPEPFYDRKIALDANDSYKALIKQFKVKRSQIHRNVKTLKKIVEQRLNGGVSSHKKEEIEFQKFITNLVTDVFPKLERTTFKLYKSMDSAYEECINRNEKSDEALNKPQDGSSSYKYDFDEFEEFTLGNESFDIYDFMDGTEGFFDKIKAGWDWFVNLIKRFINWITGKSKSKEKLEKDVKNKVNENIKNIEKGPGVYYAPDTSYLHNKYRLAVFAIEECLRFIVEDAAKSKSAKEFIENSTNLEKDLSNLFSSMFELSMYEDMGIVDYPNPRDAKRELKTCVDYINYISDKLKKAEQHMIKLKNIVEKYPDDVYALTPGKDRGIFLKITKIISEILPTHAKAYEELLQKLNKTLDDCNAKNREIGADKYIDAAESYGLKVNIPSITSDIAYEGLEEEYEAIKTILSECDANVNGYVDDCTFFGTEGFTDKVKLYAHKAWDAIRRFFYWIASKFSDKYKEKYAIEKVRAGFNSLVSEYSDYMSYDEFHEGYNIGKTAMDNLMKELAASGESQHINLFGITSGLESSEGKSITVTDYAAMNKAMDQIGEDAKDLAKFTKFLVDMMKNYQASEADFKSCLTPGLKEFPNKLSRIKFPGTKTITPKEAGQFKKDVNEALDNCKQFKAVIDFLNKNKTSVDKYLAHPAIKDHEMTKAIIEAMNRYYIPAVKQITNIIDWYLRCINTDMRKMKDAINSK